MLVFVEGGKPEDSEKTFGARTITNNKLHSHVTPEIEPGPQQWEAIPLTNTSLLPFSTVILCKITCCTCDLPLSMLGNESVFLHT